MLMHELKRSDAEIDRVLDWAFKGREKGSHYPGMSYEDGLVAMLDWLTGVEDTAPDEE